MGRINGKNVLQVVRTVGTGGSETSGCFALNNTHLLVNTQQARYYEGALSDIDNREGFSLKAGDTLIGDNNIIYKLISIDETLETFVCLKLWELNNIPTLLIDFSQMYSQNVINLSPEQVELLNTFSVLYLDIPPASDVIHQVIVKNENTMNNKLSFTGYELDTTNNQVKVNEFLIDTTGNTMTISSITLGASKQLYQHNISLQKYASGEYCWLTLKIINDSNSQFTTIPQILNFLDSIGINQVNTKFYEISGSFTSNSRQIVYNAWGCVKNGNDFYVSGIKQTDGSANWGGFNSFDLIDDTVNAL